MIGEEIFGETGAFGAEKQHVPGLEPRFGVARLGEGREKPPARTRHDLREVGQVEVLMHVDEVPVVYAGASNRFFVDAKPEAPDQVERRARGGTEAGDAARVLRDLRGKEGDVKRPGERGDAEPRGFGIGHGEEQLSSVCSARS